MIYLDSFKFAPENAEEDFLYSMKRTCYDTFYPFLVFPKKGFSQIDFSDITILYGGNGSGKSTALNLIASKIEADRDTVYNRTNFYEEYLELCKVRFEDSSYSNKVILTSDGVFDCLLDIRHVNQGIDIERDKALEDYASLKMMSKYPGMFSEGQRTQYEEVRRNPLANAAKFKQINMANSKTQSRFVRENVADSIREKSNGESAFDYFVNHIESEGIYILDEPENSLSPKLQLELVKFLQDSARYFNCQLIIATHSPFILSISGAKIYDLDQTPVDIRNWTELENVRTYYEFFEKHHMEFE